MTCVSALGSPTSSRTRSDRLVLRGALDRFLDCSRGLFTGHFCNSHIIGAHGLDESGALLRFERYEVDGLVYWRALALFCEILSLALDTFTGHSCLLGLRDRLEASLHLGLYFSLTDHVWAARRTPHIDVR